MWWCGNNALVVDVISTEILLTIVCDNEVLGMM